MSFFLNLYFDLKVEMEMEMLSKPNFGLLKASRTLITRKILFFFKKGHYSKINQIELSAFEHKKISTSQNRHMDIIPNMIFHGGYKFT